MLIIDDILLAPIKGLVFLGKKISEVAEQELSDEGSIKEQLMELQLKFEMDEIDEEEYDRREGELLDQLDQLRSREQNREKENK